MSRLVQHHEKRCHINFDACRKRLNKPKATEDDPNPKCEACDKTKMPELTTPKDGGREACDKGYSLHIDISPMFPPTIGQEYTRIVQIMDERSKYVMKYVMKKD